MANFSASFSGIGSGRSRSWSLVFDDAADTITLTATHTLVDGSPCPDPAEYSITFTINSGASVTVNLLDGDITPGGTYDGGGKILNDGPRVRTGTRLRLSADRAAAITYTTVYRLN